MHNYYITHKVFLACTIIGSTPSILGCLLCLSQQQAPAPAVAVLAMLGVEMVAVSPARPGAGCLVVRGGDEKVV